MTGPRSGPLGDSERTAPVARQPVPGVATCPLLGLPGDQSTHYSFSHGGHRCHARLPAPPIEATHQASFCLSPAYPGCSWYREWQERGATDGGVAAGGIAAAGTRTEPVRLLEAARARGPVGEWSTGPPRHRGPARIRLAALAAVVVLAVGALIATQLLPRGPEGVAGPLPTRRPSPSPAASPSPSAAPTPSPAASPAATPVPPTPTPPPVPSASSPVERVHVVQAGEWLSSIADLYGTTVDRLAELNDIEDPDVIEVGQEILLPPEAP